MEKEVCDICEEYSDEGLVFHHPEEDIKLCKRCQNSPLNVTVPDSELTPEERGAE